MPLTQACSDMHTDTQITGEFSTLSSGICVLCIVSSLRRFCVHLLTDLPAVVPWQVSWTQARQASLTKRRGHAW